MLYENITTIGLGQKFIWLAELSEGTVREIDTDLKTNNFESLPKDKIVRLSLVNENNNLIVDRYGGRLRVNLSNFSVVVKYNGNNINITDFPDFVDELLTFKEANALFNLSYSTIRPEIVGFRVGFRKVFIIEEKNVNFFIFLEEKSNVFSVILYSDLNDFSALLYKDDMPFKLFTKTEDGLKVNI